MRISDWSSDVCSSDLQRGEPDERQELPHPLDEAPRARRAIAAVGDVPARVGEFGGQRLADRFGICAAGQAEAIFAFIEAAGLDQPRRRQVGKADDRNGAEREAFAQTVVLFCDDAVDKERSEEQTTELHSLMRPSYALFYLKKTIL